MNSDLTHAVTATSKDAQYDASAKRLLGQKSILAHILEKTVEEFKGMNPFVSFLRLKAILSSVLFP